MTEMTKSETRQPTRQPRSSALSPFDEMDRLFDNFFKQGWLQPRQWQWPEWAELNAPFEGRTPKVDLVERDNEIEVTAELPGVKKDDLDISLTNNSLTIKATTEQEKEDKEGEFHRREISRGSFVRTLALPADVDREQAKAKFEDGLLKLTVPKMQPAKRHSIKVD